MKHLRRMLLLIVAPLLIHHATAKAATIEELESQHTSIAMRMDTAYREAGERIDIAGFDLQEAKRQKKTVPATVTQQVAKADKELRAQWQSLENERIGIAKRIALLTGAGSGSLLTIENLTEGGSGETDWFALRYAAIILPDGNQVRIAPRDFRGGTYRDNYAYQCEPASMVAVYGRQSTTHTARASVTVPGKPRGASLEISGLDHDKPGRTAIRISLNGVTLSEGPNEFQKVGWSEKRYAIPDSAWEAVVAQESSTEVAAAVEAWKERIVAFEKAAPHRAAVIDTLTAKYRKNLVWKKRTYATEWWRKSFVRGICYETDSLLGPDHNRPWFPDNKEFIAKAFDAAGINLIYDYPGGDYEELGARQYSELARHNDRIGTPLIEVFWPSAHPEANTPKFDPPAKFYTDAAAAHANLNAYLTRITKDRNDPAAIRGVAVDEPRIQDSDRFEDSPEIIVAWREFLARRQPYLAKAGIVILPEAAPVNKVITDADRPAWMEWQYFKMEYVANFYEKFSGKLNAETRVMLPVVQDYLAYEPQVAPYPAYGARLPLVSTDLYNNGAINEAFGMDLLRSVSGGKALLVNGSGYSARNPSRFHRTLANGMLRADGVVTWIHTFASKYRYRYFFVRVNGLDDRGRNVLDAWRPEYWPILKKTYTGMKRAEPWLLDTQSTAQIGVLYSMRSVVAESAQGSFWGNRIFRNVLYTYNALLNTHRSVEACMVEGLTPEKLQRYRVLYLIDGQCLTADECNRLREWVRGGGTLVVSGRTGLKDEWGRPQSNYALADVMGVSFEESRKGQTSMTVNGGNIPARTAEYNSEFSYAAVEAKGAIVLASWSNGDAALLRHSFGAGRVYTFTADRPGEYAADSEPQSGRYQWSKPGFPELFNDIAGIHLKPEPVRILNAPNDLEVQAKKKGAAWIIQLLDWRDARSVKNLKLSVDLPGNWRASYALEGKSAGLVSKDKPLNIRPVSIHEMIVLQPVKS